MLSFMYDKRSSFLRSKLGNTAVHLAVLHGRSDTVTLLIKEGADLNIKNNVRFTPSLIKYSYILNYVLIKMYLYIIMQFGLTVFDIPSWLRDVTYLTAFIATTWHTTPIHKACYENDVALLQVLLDSGSLAESLTLRDQYGWTALHVAVFMNSIEAAKLLVSRGANIYDVVGACRHTALHLACSRGLSRDTVRWLVKNNLQHS